MNILEIILVKEVIVVVIKGPKIEGEIKATKIPDINIPNVDFNIRRPKVEIPKIDIHNIDINAPSIEQVYQWGIQRLY